MVNGDDYAVDLLLSVYEHSVGGSLCLRMALWGTTNRDNKLCWGLSFCVQRNELCLVRFTSYFGKADIKCLDGFYSVGSVDVTRSYGLMIMFPSRLCLGTCWIE